MSYFSPTRPALSLILFFFNDTATTEIYTLSLHDALPIYRIRRPQSYRRHSRPQLLSHCRRSCRLRLSASRPSGRVGQRIRTHRSEEHTSELQSPDHLVCRLLLEKKTNKRRITLTRYTERH